jgi:hypothetical protein
MFWYEARLFAVWFCQPEQVYKHLRPPPTADRPRRSHLQPCQFSQPKQLTMQIFGRRLKWYIKDRYRDVKGDPVRSRSSRRDFGLLTRPAFESTNHTAQEDYQ